MVRGLRFFVHELHARSEMKEDPEFIRELMTDMCEVRGGAGRKRFERGARGEKWRREEGGGRREEGGGRREEGGGRRDGWQARRRQSHGYGLIEVFLKRMLLQECLGSDPVQRLQSRNDQSRSWQKRVKNKWQSVRKASAICQIMLARGVEAHHHLLHFLSHLEHLRVCVFGLGLGPHCLFLELNNLFLVER
jgi:hypothetical protein